MKLAVEDLFDVKHCMAKVLFERVSYPWEALPLIRDFLFELARNLPHDFERIDECVWVGKGTAIEKTAVIKGPAIIGHQCEIRHSAYIRENVIIGNGCVVGNSCELKNSITLDDAQIPHFNYVGDSVLGYKSHLGAGVILSNLKSTGSTVKIKQEDEILDTGLRKFGAMVGDYAEIGCNSVLNPGTIIGKRSIVYPMTSVRGAVPQDVILKSSGEQVEIK